MGRGYAGVLGPLAFAVVTIRGALNGGGAESTLLAATLALAAFGAIGYVVGRLAGFIVEESVRGRLAAELAEHNAHNAAATPGNES